ncbi:MAG: ABC transporter substrate-binding protein [Acidobacteriota bacterium]
MNIFKRSFSVIIVLIVLIPAFVNCEQNLRLGSIDEPMTMDPAESWEDISSFYIMNIFDRLVDIDEDTLKIKPSLSTGWESNKEGTVWKFRLRKGVSFHDGSKFDADAVVFSFRRQMENKYKYGEFVLFKEVFPFLKSVSKTGKYEVEFVLNAPFFPFPSTLSVDCASIISPEAIKVKKEKFRESPVGTGPYRLAEWKKGKKVTLTANREYWKGNPGVDKFISIFETKVDKLFDMFRNQQIDILTSFSLSKMVVFKGFPWVRYAFSPTLSTSYIAFNMKNKYLKRLGVRKAINYLWNKDILKFVFQDHVEPLCSLFPKGMSGYDCNLDKYPISVEKALSLLKNEGLSRGFELRFLILRSADLQLPTVINFARNLKKAGIKIKIIKAGDAEYNAKVSKGEYDLTFSGWIADYPDPFSIISPLFSKKLQSEGLANFSTGENKDIVDMIEKVRRIKDPDEREKIYVRLNNLIVERALLVPLYQNINLVLYNKRIGKLKIDRFGKIEIFNIGKK